MTVKPRATTRASKSKDNSKSPREIKSNSLKRTSPQDSSDGSGSEHEVDGDSPPPRSAKPVKRAKRIDQKAWSVPDTSDEEKGHDEHEYLAKHGWRQAHNHWPSRWRSNAAYLLVEDTINKTVSLGGPRQQGRSCGRPPCLSITSQKRSCCACHIGWS